MSFTKRVNTLRTFHIFPFPFSSTTGTTSKCVTHDMYVFHISAITFAAPTCRFTGTNLIVKRKVSVSRDVYEGLGILYSII